MSKPLVPFDGSASAMRALRPAMDALQGRTHAELHQLHVCARPVHAFPGKLVPPDLIDEELRREGAGLLLQAEAVAQAAGVPFSCHVRIGRAAEEIAATAIAQGCDTIVMGEQPAWIRPAQGRPARAVLAALNLVGGA